jgi:uncharacterized membrane protein YfcA
MQQFVLLAIVGFFAQLVDGALGMAYGVTSTSLLLSIGLSSRAASASVHMAELGTTLASGIAHWKLGNVNWRTVGILAVPGGIGAFLGATALSKLPGEIAKPWTSTILFVLGAYVLIRFLFWHDRKKNETGKRLPKRFLMPLGFFGGLIDAMGGGGWGPVATPSLLASGRMLPRQVIGTVDTSEFVIAASATLGFLLYQGSETMLWHIVGAILLGGIFAAPLAAWLVRFLHPRVLGTAVGGLIIITNARTLMQSLNFEQTATIITYAVLTLIWASSLLYTYIQLKKNGDTILALNNEQKDDIHGHNAQANEDPHATAQQPVGLSSEAS